MFTQASATSFHRSFKDVHAGRRAATRDHFHRPTFSTMHFQGRRFSFKFFQELNRRRLPPAAAATFTQDRPTKYFQGLSVQIPPARRRLPPSELSSVVDPHSNFSVESFISSRRGRSKVRTHVPTPMCGPNLFHFFRNGKKCENPLEFLSFSFIDKQTAFDEEELCPGRKPGGPFTCFENFAICSKYCC